MQRGLRGINPHWCRFSDAHEQRLSEGAFRCLLSDSTFAPAPMGNVMAETWRFYEALEVGCIPIVERHWRLNYFEDLLGPNPIPTFYSWPSARRFMLELRSQPAQL